MSHTISKATMRRVRRLLEARLRAFAALADAGDAPVSAADLEKQAKALAALMKALEAAGIALPEEERSVRADVRDTDALRRRLARHLEGLLAPTRPPCRAGDAGS